MAVKFASQSRQLKILGVFCGYHLTKTILWRFGYFAKFFHRTRFLSIPLLIGSLYWNIKITMENMRDAGVLEYNKRRTRFDRDSRKVEKILKSRLDLAKEKQAATENTTNIKKLID